MQSFMAVPVDVLEHMDYPIGRMGWQGAAANRHPHHTRKPADAKADEPTGGYAATCWPRGFMRTMSPWT